MNAAVSYTHDQLRALEAEFVTAAVTTQNSRYLMVARPNFAMLIRENDGKVIAQQEDTGDLTGPPCKGAGFSVYQGCLYLLCADHDVPIWKTTEIKSFFILEN
jgi:hypothetical protein